jgi:hypothetical protein
MMPLMKVVGQPMATLDELPQPQKSGVVTPK